MKKEKITLTEHEHKMLCVEGYLSINDKDIEIKEIERNYIDSGRHQEYHELIFQRLDNNKYFSASYSESTQDTMEWDDCNYEFDIVEVYPKTITKVIYE